MNPSGWSHGGRIRKLAPSVRDRALRSMRKTKSSPAPLHQNATARAGDDTAEAVASQPSLRYSAAGNLPAAASPSAVGIFISAFSFQLFSFCLS